MKLLHLTILLLILSAISAMLYVADNMQLSVEQGASMAFRPIKHGLKSSQIKRDISYGDFSYDIYFPEEAVKTFNFPRIPAELSIVSKTLRILSRSFGYVPEKRYPVLIFIHGGFFSGGNKKNYAHICGFAVRNGFICAIPDFPHLPGRIGQFFITENEISQRGYAGQYVQLGISIANITETFGTLVDLNRIHVMGHGSGGYHALRLAEKYNSVKSVTLLSAIIDLNDKNAMFEVNYPLIFKESQKLSDKQSKFKFANKNLKVILLLSENDIPFIKEQNRQFHKSQQFASQLEILEKESHHSVIFKLGRRNHLSTRYVSDFWQKVLN